MRLLLGKINVNDWLLQVDAPECLLFPGADIKFEEFGEI
jgi:hypothetical protein